FIQILDTDTCCALHRIEFDSCTAIILCACKGLTTLFAGSRDGRIEMYDAASGNKIGILDKQEGSIISLCAGEFENTEFFISGNIAGQIKVWNMNSVECIFDEWINFGSIREISMIPGYSWFLSVDDDYRMTYVDFEKKMRLGTFDAFSWNNPEPTPRINCGLLGENGRVFYAGITYPFLYSNKTAIICAWDIESKRRWKFKDGHKRGITRMAANGQVLLSGGYDKVLKLWDIESGACLKVFEEISDTLKSITFLGPKGLALAVYTYSVVFIDCNKSELIYNGNKIHGDCTYRLRETASGYSYIGSSDADDCEDPSEWSSFEDDHLAVRQKDGFIDILLIDDSPERIMRRFTGRGAVDVLFRSRLQKDGKPDTLDGKLEMQERFPTYTNYFTAEGILASAHPRCGVKLWRASDDTVFCLPGYMDTAFEIKRGKTGSEIAATGENGCNPFVSDKNVSRELSRDGRILKLTDECGKILIYHLPSLIRTKIMEGSIATNEIFVFNREANICLRGGLDVRLGIKPVRNGSGRKRAEEAECDGIKSEGIKGEEIRLQALDSERRTDHFGINGGKMVFIKADRSFTSALIGSTDGKIIKLGLTGKNKMCSKPEEALIDSSGKFIITMDGSRGGSCPEVRLRHIEDSGIREMAFGRLQEIEAMSGMFSQGCFSAGLFIGEYWKKGILSVNTQGGMFLGVYDLKTCEFVKKLEGHKKAPSSAAFSRDGFFAATGGNDDMIILWDMRSCEKISSCHMKGGLFSLISISDTGAVLVLRAFGGYELYDLRSGRFIRGFRRSGAIPEMFTVLLDNGSKLLSRSGFEMCIYNIENGEPEMLLRGHTDVVTHCVVDGEERLAASAQWFGCDAFLWDLKTAELLSVLSGHTDEITALEFLKNGRFLLTGSKDCTIRLWDTETMQEAGFIWLGQEVCRILPVQPDNTFTAVLEDRMVLIRLD
ncbi:MAG: hypothetical protein HGA22_03140, partial [Clostridiales bacterium]|nr:hypothetical protein [Clostridiales bacterium]